jgi:predicted acetyltransferase
VGARPRSLPSGRSAPTEEQAESLGRVLPFERVLAARDGARVVGGASSFPFELAIPGGRLRAAGVTTVAVMPTHRRRGVLQAMMRTQLDACRERGEYVAYLLAMEDTIYGRFGYGMALLSGEIEIPRERTAYRDVLAPAGQLGLVPLGEAEALVAPIYERVMATTPGMFGRTTEWWQARVLGDPLWRRGGMGELQCAILEMDGRPAGYALYRVNFGTERGVSTGAVFVAEAMGDSPVATHAVWRFLLDFDWMARVRAGLLPIDHPLFLLLAEPRRLRFNLRDGLWVRLVDVGAALSARSYAAEHTVMIEVRDAFCPWNAGRWRVGPGGATRTEAPADLSCDVTALGAVYLGGFTWPQLARGLRVEEHHPGAVARADALFRTPFAPWCAEIF